jgi:hypothetical protein
MNDGDKPLDIAKTEAEIAKMIVETGKLFAEMVKLEREARWHPVIVIGACTATILAGAKLLSIIPH